MPESANTSLTEVIARCHHGLDELFLLHQEAVLLGRFDDAIRLLGCFRELHDLHMRLEDEKLIPKLDELPDRGRWPASLYTDEHAKVHELMRKTRNGLLSLSKSRVSGKAPGREIIAFLDQEKTFKGLCEHHQEREESGMLPELDKQTGDKWRAGIIEPFLKEWNDCIRSNSNLATGMDLLQQNGADNRPFLAIMPHQEFFGTSEAPGEE